MTFVSASKMTFTKPLNFWLANNLSGCPRWLGPTIELIEGKMFAMLYFISDPEISFTPPPPV